MTAARVRTAVTGAFLAVGVALAALLGVISAGVLRPAVP